MSSIRKRKLRSGKVVWQFDYRDAAGARRHRQFSTRREADAFMLRTHSEIAAGTHSVDSTSVTVQGASDVWLARCERDKLERTTIRSYQEHVSLHIVPYIGGVKLSRLTRPAVNAFVDRLLADGRSQDMARRVRGSLAAIVSEAQDRGLVAVNNVRQARQRKRSGRERPRPGMPTRAELRAIIDVAPARVRPLILTAIFTGLRGSELRGLTWEDVDLKTGEINVRRRVDRYGKFGPPKSAAGVRDIPLAPALISALREWRLACPKGELDLVFPNGVGNVESHMNILHRIFWPVQIAAGVIVMRDAKDELGNITKVADAKYSLHALRHAAAALWIEQGLGPKRIQMLMGHSSIQMTFDVYGYLLEAQENVREAIGEIEARLLK
jgi:integrase